MIGIDKSKYYSWQARLGLPNQHNHNLPKSNWLTPDELEKIKSYASKHYVDNGYFLRDGYRRLTYKMLDDDIVAVSPSSVYRVLSTTGLLNKWSTKKTSSKGNGFKQPDKPHKHWHTDIKYVNYRGTFFFLISVMDGYSRYIVHHELRANMTEYDVELTIQKAIDKYPKERPRIISDNGGQFISKDFQEFIKAAELTHVRTSVAYPQSNGKLERFHRSIGDECLKIKSFISIEDARRIIKNYVELYNTKRLHSALGFLTPEIFLNGNEKECFEIREAKLNKATITRKLFWTKCVA